MRLKCQKIIVLLPIKSSTLFNQPIQSWQEITQDVCFYRSQCVQCHLWWMVCKKKTDSFCDPNFGAKDRHFIWESGFDCNLCQESRHDSIPLCASFFSKQPPLSVFIYVQRQRCCGSAASLLPAVSSSIRGAFYFWIIGWNLFILPTGIPSGSEYC